MTMASEAMKPIRSALSEDDFREVCARALQIAADLDGRQGDYFAEFIPGVSPAWHVLTITPGLEKDALADLIRRRFGVYDAMFDERYLMHGKPRLRRSRLLPGYLLLFCWDVDRHRRRILACSGVTNILQCAGGDRPVVVPDAFVTAVQRNELQQAFSLLAPRMKRRKQRRYDGERVVGFHTKSYLHPIEKLAAAERIALFRSRIGLAS